VGSDPKQPGKMYFTINSTKTLNTLSTLFGCKMRLPLHTYRRECKMSVFLSLSLMLSSQ